MPLLAQLSIFFPVGVPFWSVSHTVPELHVVLMGCEMEERRMQLSDPVAKNPDAGFCVLLLWSYILAVRFTLNWTFVTTPWLWIP